MFSLCCNDCLYYEELKNKKNAFFNFLIVLPDEYHKKIFWESLSLSNKVYIQDFPGNIDIIYKQELQENSNFIINDTVVLKKIYIKIPNEKIYIDSSKYQQCITTDFLATITMLNSFIVQYNRLFEQRRDRPLYNDM